MPSVLAAEVAQLCATGQDALAIETGERLVAKAPDDVELRLRLGFVYGALQRFDDAFAHLDHAEEHAKGERSDVFVQRANLEKFSNVGDPRASAQTAIEIEPLQAQWVYFLAQDEWRGDFLVLDEAQVVCSPIPKSASTSLKQLFEQLEPNTGGERAHRRFGGGRLRSDRLRLAELDLANFYRFAVVRDDIDRLISYHRRNVMQSESLRRAGHGLERYLGLSTTPGVDELAIHLEHYRYVFLDVRHHSLPSRAYLHADPAFYDDVFTLDDMDQLEERLVDHTGTPLTIEHKLRSAERSGDELSPESAEALGRFFDH